MTNNQETYVALLEKLRWKGEPQCPYCSSTKAAKLKQEHRYHCNDCFTSYSVTVGTFFHKTHVDLQKWFQAIELVITRSPNISTRKLATEIGVNKNTAAYMLIRIRRAVKEETPLLKSILQTFSEGKPKKTLSTYLLQDK